ncbi:MAG: LytTR family DNA-binding domain-containing protein [Bacteroidota bacterium]
MIKALIIDDEPLAANVLRLMIERDNPEISSLVIETDTSKAISLIETYKPQLIFLDIIMPEITGFELLNKIPQKNFDVIFTTAFNEYAIQAIRFSAVDYLLKPIDADELKNAIKRHLEKQLGEQEFEGLYQNLMNNLKARQEVDFKLALATVNGTLFISTDELIRCEGERNYTCFYLTNNRKHLSAKTIKEYEEILSGHGFIRVHKSHLVNSRFVHVYLNEGAVLLKDKTKIPVSRQRKDAVKKELDI